LSHGVLFEGLVGSKETYLILTRVREWGRGRLGEWEWKRWGEGERGGVGKRERGKSSLFPSNLNIHPLNAFNPLDNAFPNSFLHL